LFPCKNRRKLWTKEHLPSYFLNARYAVTASAASVAAGGGGVKSGCSFVHGETQSKAMRRILDKRGFNTEAVGHPAGCTAPAWSVL